MYGQRAPERKTAQIYKLTVHSPNVEGDGLGRSHPRSRHPHVGLALLPVEHVQRTLVSADRSPGQTCDVSVSNTQPVHSSTDIIIIFISSAVPFPQHVARGAYHKKIPHIKN